MGELVLRVLGPLARRDQRRSGALYLRGLLTVTGPKTIRNIASHTAVPADVQRLHHFISDSTWCWRPVRTALARHMARPAPPRAWLLHTVTVPRPHRAGAGVDHFIDPRTGHPVSAQRAAGLWAVTEWGAYPVDWHLRLTPRWLEDPLLRERAAIPQDATALDTVTAGLDMALDPACRAAAPTAPLLLDARDAAAGPIAARLTAAGLPYLLRISASHPLHPVTSATATGYGTAPATGHGGPGRGTGRPPTARPLTASTARQLAVAAGYGRLCTPGPGGGRSDIARVPCRPADAPPGPRHRHLLFARRDSARPRDTTFWLTGPMRLPTSALLRLTTAFEQATGDVTATAGRTGLYDFEGRTFAGWHRHTTLASVAHAATLLRSRAGHLPGPPPLPALLPPHLPALLPPHPAP
ncbi:IS701 family transposase [Streptomyces tagetis]|uniref:Transposase n=1 Tax=Streptomyces tagetis TaxID=2820809 RepID=A0A941B0T9_9ACTN|nr:transposase [Streptomyces sp. RG38]MBQ0827186.1 transposase [Streptomyces sp. RG38]